MLRLALLALLASACSLYASDDVDDPAGPDAAFDPRQCPHHTATIFEPADGATVPASFTARIRWNEANVPDRYTSMVDDFGNFFIPGGETVNGDGSISDPYTLPAGGSFTFEVGWICDAGNDGPEVPLAHVRIHTAP